MSGERVAQTRVLETELILCLNTLQWILRNSGLVYPTSLSVVAGILKLFIDVPNNVFVAFGYIGGRSSQTEQSHNKPYTYVLWRYENDSMRESTMRCESHASNGGSLKFCGALKLIRMTVHLH